MCGVHVLYMYLETERSRRTSVNISGLNGERRREREEKKREREIRTGERDEGIILMFIHSCYNSQCSVEHPQYCLETAVFNRRSRLDSKYTHYITT